MSNEPTKPPSKGLHVLGQPASEDESADDDFLQAERQISSQEFLEALLEDRREDIAKMIVHDDRLVKSRDAAGATAILLACYHGLDDMLGILMRSEVELDVFETAAVGDAERVRELVANDPSRLSETSGDGFPALQLACYFGRVEAALAILDLAADEELDVKELIERPAQNPTRVRPLHSSAACRDAEASLALVRRLLEEGADVEAEQAGGFRALHAAASGGRRELVEQLLAHGADVTAESDLGKTPADFADERGHGELAELLRSSGN